MKLIDQAEAMDRETGEGLALMAAEERKAIRAAALEDAAKICEGLFSGRSTSIENIALGKAAAAIRAKAKAEA